jgi:hypothetical protein
MSTNPIFGPKARFFDANGDPLSGGLLYSYAAGTSTPLSTYTTRAGSIANANPVVLNANGEADIWTTPGVDYKLELRNSSNVVQWTVDNVPSAADDTVSTSDASVDPGGRLSLTTGTPVTTSDVTGASTVFYIPYGHSKVPLYDGTSWALYSIATELSQTTSDTTKSPAAVANNSNYDLFVWNDVGTLRCTRGPAWTSDTARGTGVGTTEIARKDGRYVNANSISNGPAAQRGLYVGTVRSDGSAQINDSMAKRHVWNTYNWLLRPMRVTEATNSWGYNTATWRQANNSAANQLDVVCGLNERTVNVRIHASADCGAAEHVRVGIGLDSTAGFVSGCINVEVGTPTNVVASVVAAWSGFTGLGRHTLTWLEKGNAGGGGVIWFGDSGAGTDVQSGIAGEVMA